MEVEVKLADVAGVRIRNRLGTALSTLYRLLLLNPQQGCTILCRLRKWKRSNCLTDTWAANTTCWDSLGVGWEGYANKEILLSGLLVEPPQPP